MARSNGKEKKKAKNATKVRPKKKAKFSIDNNDIVHAPKNPVAGNPTAYLYGKEAAGAKKSKKQKSKNNQKQKQKQKIDQTEKIRRKRQSDMAKERQSQKAKSQAKKAKNQAKKAKKNGSSNFVARKGKNRIFVARFPVIGTNTKPAPWMRGKIGLAKDKKENVSTQTEGNGQHRKIMNGAFSISETALKHFNSELEAFATYVKLTDTEIRARKYLIEKIQRSCRDLFGVDDSQCQVFGSFAALPVCIFESDIDLAIWGVVEPDKIDDGMDQKPASVPKRENSTLDEDQARANQKKQERVLKWKALIDSASKEKEEADAIIDLTTERTTEATQSLDKTIIDLTTQEPTSTENIERPLFVLDREGDSPALDLTDRGAVSPDDDNEDDEAKKSGDDKDIADWLDDDDDDDDNDNDGDGDYSPSDSDSSTSDDADKLENFWSREMSGDSSTSSTNDDSPVTPSETNKIFKNGTIIGKKFDQGYFEGEVTRYDPEAKLYYIVYTDGDSEEMTYEEVDLHLKPSQEYSNSSELASIQDGPDVETGKEDEIVDFNDIPTRRSRGQSSISDYFADIPTRRPRGQSFISLSSETTCSVEATLDESAMEVSFVVQANKPATRAPVGPTGKTKTRVINALYKLTRPLRPFTSTMNVRKHARVPIINMVTHFGFECDIAIAGHNGTDTSSYATTQLSRFKSFATIVVLVKVLLNQQGLDKPFTGGLGSFALYVLVARHIEKHLDQGGNDDPAEVLFTFFFRYGGVKHSNNKISSSCRTRLSQYSVIQTKDGGSIDLKSSFRIENCISVFESCWQILQKRLKGKFNQRFSILQYMIDAVKLEAGRSECKSKCDKKLRQLCGNSQSQSSSYTASPAQILGLPIPGLPVPGLPREEKKDACGDLEAQELIRGYGQSVERFMPVEEPSSKKRKKKQKKKNNKQKKRKRSGSM